MPDLSLFTEKLRRFETNALLLPNDTHTLRKIEHSPTTWLGRARHFCVAQFPHDLRLLFGSKRLEDWVYQVTLLYCAANGYFVPQLLLAYSTFFPKRQFVRFALACMTCAMVYMAFQRWSGLEAFLCDEVSWQGLFSTAIDWALYLLLSTLLWYFRQFKLEREHQSLIRIEKLESELKFLRTQMNPHFIFNTLNNIYALALQNHPNAAPMVARLVDILRYVLYEGSAEKASLVQEIEVVRQFIEIHRLRNLQSKNIDFYIEGPAQGWKITPMLLLNFIENCFKYSDLDQDEEAWLRIEIDISQEGDFRFSAQNSLSADFTKTENDSPQGIGLKNARRQLELGYYKQHKLDISSTHDIFSVILTLQLEPLL